MGRGRGKTPDRQHISFGLGHCAENPRICFANPHRLRPPAAALARGLKTLTRFLYARALHRVRFSAVRTRNKKAGRYEYLPACYLWWSACALSRTIILEDSFNILPQLLGNLDLLFTGVEEQNRSIFVKINLIHEYVK